MLHKTRWTLQKVAQRLQLISSLVYRDQVPLPPFHYHELDSPMAVPPVAPYVDDSQWPQIPAHSYWGKWQCDFMLRTKFRFPEGWHPQVPAALYLPLGEADDFFGHPEALAYIDGKPYATADRFHKEILLPQRWKDDRLHTLALHGWTGLGRTFSGEDPRQLFMGRPALVQIDLPTRQFIATVRVALGAARKLGDQHEPVQGQLLDALDRAFKLLDTREPFGDRFYDSVHEAHRVLREAIEAAGSPQDVDVYAVGHAHIDLAWLWTVSQTRRKAGRTFHTVMRLMEQFPEYRFTQSQPQLYEWVRNDYPDLFETIKERVAEGRWEPTGGMWVEADCNLTGAESLARQLLLGRSFFREHFGAGTASPILWLPDVFGYAWNLPQLIRQANLRYFFTIKIGWSQYNRMPYDSFWWQGLDGTKVLTHFSPTPESADVQRGTYNSRATPADVVDTWRNFQQKEQSRCMLLAFGHGDGGGGPTAEMLENINVMRDFPAIPRVHLSKAWDFFQALERDGERLPVWKGELYLEYHRGTYTTQARIKRANRKAEFLLHDAEFLAAYAARLDPDYNYPTADLHRAWELICLNQFHDIIPGSSIGEVYAEALPQYDAVMKIGAAVRDKALHILWRKLGGDLLLINPTAFARQDLAFCAGCPEEAGQAVMDGVLLDPDELPPYSVTPWRTDGARAEPQTSLHASPSCLENDFLRVELDDNGDLTRIYDKEVGREVLPSGRLANQFQAFEDRPLEWDAWDIDIFFDDKMWLAEPAESIEVVENGPLRATLKIERCILNSRYTQYVSLAHNSRRLDFNTTIDWRERHILLKVAFPIDVLAPRATYDIQWGNVERPTHRNTSWDWARFETVAHKWVDVSEGDYGASLLNDCKYGHDILDNTPHGTVMRLSLLRSPTQPDPEADQGLHDFVYSLLPHVGTWETETIRQSYFLNDPILIYRPPADAEATVQESYGPMVAVDQPNVVIETVKQAEDGEGIIVRLYESQRKRGPFTLTAAFPIQAAWRTNLLEDNEEALAVEEGRVRYHVRPYEIVNLRLV